MRLGRADAVRSLARRLPQAAGRGTAAPRDRVTDEDWRERARARCTASPTGRPTWANSSPNEPWRDVLARWWPRLLPGVAAAATHGIIRTAHAARSLAAAEDGASPGPRHDELARALGYWAAQLRGAARQRATRGRPGRGGRGARPARAARAAGGRPDHRPAQGGTGGAARLRRRGLQARGGPATRRKRCAAWRRSSPRSSSATAARSRSRSCTR